MRNRVRHSQQDLSCKSVGKTCTTNGTRLKFECMISWDRHVLGRTGILKRVTLRKLNLSVHDKKLLMHTVVLQTIRDA